MDHLLGLVGDGYALVAADRKVSNSIIAVKHDEDKILPLDSSKLLGCVGELGDTKNFTEFIQKNIALYGLRNGCQLSTHATAHYVRCLSSVVQLFAPSTFLTRRTWWTMT